MSNIYHSISEELAALNIEHPRKPDYWDVCVTSCIIPVIISLMLSLVWGLFI